MHGDLSPSSSASLDSEQSSGQSQVSNASIESRDQGESHDAVADPQNGSELIDREEFFRLLPQPEDLLRYVTEKLQQSQQVASIDDQQYVNNLRQKIHELESNANQLQSEASNSATFLKQIESEKALFTKMVEKYHQENIKLQADFSNAQFELTTQKAAYQSSIRTIESKTAHIIQLQEELKRCGEERDTESEEKSKSSVELAQTKVKLLDAEVKLRMTTDNLQQLQKLYDEANKEAQVRQQQVYALGSEKSKVEFRVADIELELEQKNTIIASNKQHIAQLSDQNISYIRKVAQLERKIAAQEKEIETKSFQTNLFRENSENYEALKRQQKAQDIQHKAQLVELQQKINQLENELDARENEPRRVIETLFQNAQEGSMESSSQVISRLVQKYEEKCKEAQEANKQSALATAHLESIQQALLSKQPIIEQQKLQYQQALLEKDKLAKSVSSWYEKSDHLETVIVQLKTKLAQQENDNELLQIQRDDLNRQIQLLLAESQKKADTITQLPAFSYRNIKQMQERHQQAVMLNHELQQQLQVKEDNFKTALHELKQLQDQQNILKANVAQIHTASPNKSSTPRQINHSTSSMSSATSHWEAKYHRVHQKVKQLRSDYQQAQSNLSQLQEKLSVSITNETLRQKEIDNLTFTLNEAKRLQQSLELNVQDQRQQCISLTTQLKELQHQHAILQTTASHDSKLLQNTLEKLHKLEESHKHELASIPHLKSENLTLKENLDTLKQQVTREHRSRDALLTRIEDENKQLKQAQIETEQQYKQQNVQTEEKIKVMHMRNENQQHTLDQQAVQLHQAQEKLIAQTQQLEKVLDENKKFQEKLQENENRLQSLLQQSLAASHRFSVSPSLRDSGSGANVDQNLQLRQALSQIESLQEELLMKKEEYKELLSLQSDHAAVLQSRLDQLKEAQQQQESRLTTVQAEHAQQINQLTEQYQSEIAKNQQHQQSIQQLELEKTKLQEQTEQLQQEIVQQQETTAQLLEQIQELHQSLLQEKTKWQQQETEHTETRESLAQMREQQAQQPIEMLENVRAQHKARQDELTAFYTAQLDDCRRQITLLEQQLTAANEQNQIYIAQLDILNSVNENVALPDSDIIKVIQQEKASLQSQLEQEKQNFLIASQKSERLQQSLNELRRKYQNQDTPEGNTAPSALVDDLVIIQESNSLLRQELTSYQKKFTELKEEKIKWEEIQSQLQEEVSSSRARLQSLEHDKVKLQQLVEALQFSNATRVHIDQYEELQKKLENVQSQLEQTKKENAQLQEHLSQASNEATHLAKQQEEVLAAEKADKNAQVSSLQTSLTQAVADNKKLLKFQKFYVDFMSRRKLENAANTAATTTAAAGSIAPPANKPRATHPAPQQPAANTTTTAAPVEIPRPTGKRQRPVHTDEEPSAKKQRVTTPTAEPEDEQNMDDEDDEGEQSEVGNEQAVVTSAVQTPTPKRAKPTEMNVSLDKLKNVISPKKKAKPAQNEPNK